MEKDIEALIEETVALRAKAWGGWGEVAPETLTHLISPSLMGGPRWPAWRQGFRTAKNGKALLIASDGLSDPWDKEEEKEGNGFGLELYAITDDPIEKVPGSWAWDLVWQTSQFAAKRGDLAGLLDEMGLLSTELYDVGIPKEYSDRFVNEEGRVGVLLGMYEDVIPERIDGPLSSIRLVNVKLLTLPELEMICKGGEAAREEIASRFTSDPSTSLVSSLTRPAVV
jgi:hypothetical protein